MDPDHPLLADGRGLDRPAVRERRHQRDHAGRREVNFPHRLARGLQHIVGRDGSPVHHRDQVGPFVVGQQIEQPVARARRFGHRLLPSAGARIGSGAEEATGEARQEGREHRQTSGEFLGSSLLVRRAPMRWLRGPSSFFAQTLGYHGHPRPQRRLHERLRPPVPMPSGRRADLRASDPAAHRREGGQGPTHRTLAWIAESGPSSCVDRSGGCIRMWRRRA